jgi:hypothetical protein
MPNQPTAPGRKSGPPNGVQADSVGQSILGLLATAAEESDTRNQQSLKTVQGLSQELHEAQERIAKLEIEVQRRREALERAQSWLRRIEAEIEGRLVKQPEEASRLQ